MNTAEIATLLQNGTSKDTVLIAEATGKIFGALRSAHNKIRSAEESFKGVDFKELFRVMQAVEDGTNIHGKQPTKKDRY